MNNKGMIGLYPMVADVLHAGHLVALEEAKKHCDYLIVGLHCCPDYKVPVQTIYERFMQLRAVKWVDEIIPYQNNDDLINLLSSLDYNVYLLGEDYKNKDFANRDLLKSLHKDIVYLSRNHKFSSTNIKDRICAQREEIK